MLASQACLLTKKILPDSDAIERVQISAGQGPKNLFTKVFEPVALPSGILDQLEVLQLAQLTVVHQHRNAGRRHA